MSSNKSVIDWEHFKKRIKGLGIEKGYAVVMLTDEVRVRRFSQVLRVALIKEELMSSSEGLMSSKEELILSEKEFDKKLLDLRIFNTEKEFRIVRGDVGKEFVTCRILGKKDDEQYDDEQYIDKKAWERCISGDGSMKDKEKIKIVNHIRYDESGHAYIYDWRIADFLSNEEGETYGEK